MIEILILTFNFNFYFLTLALYFITLFRNNLLETKMFRTLLMLIFYMYMLHAYVLLHFIVHLCFVLRI